MGKTAVIRYKTRPEAADENQRLIEQVFAELAETKPDGLHYVSYRLSDGVSFIHIVTYDNDDSTLSTVVAFKRFEENFGNRVDGKPARDEVSTIGTYQFHTS